MDVASFARQAAAEAGLVPLSFVLSDLSGELPSVDADAGRPLYPASMIKTPLAAAVLYLAETGAFSLSDRVEITAANMTANDALSPLAPGREVGIGELVDLMVARSDNVATNVLFDVAGRRRATEIVQRIMGLRETTFARKLSGSLPLMKDPEWDGIHRNSHPASDAARLFEAIARDRISGARDLLGILSRQSWNDKLPAGLYPGDRFAHKTGDTDEVTHDGGILYTRQGGAYVLTVFTGLPSTAENNARFGPFMARLRTILR